MKHIYNDELYHYGKLGMKWGKRKSVIKENVKTYKKEFDKASDMSDKADKQWSVAKAAYKKTGKTRLTAIINNLKKEESPAVKNYKKEFDKASDMSDKADKQWSVAKSAYKKTGKTRLTAIINNFKYQ